MLRVNVTRDLTRLQLSDLQKEIRPICRRGKGGKPIYRGKECLYAERNIYFSIEMIKKIVLIASMCIFSSYFFYLGASLIKMLK